MYYLQIFQCMKPLLLVTQVTTKIIITGFFYIKHLQMWIWLVHHPMDHPGLLVETLVGMLLGMFLTLLIQVMTIIWFQELEVNFC